MVLPALTEDCWSKQLQPVECAGRYLVLIKEWLYEGKLGNNLVSLSHALYLARETGSELVVPTYKYFTKTAWDFRKASDRAAGTIPRQIAVTGTYSFFFKDRQLLDSWNFSALAQSKLLIDEVLPAFRIIPKHVSDAVVVHVRSGDIFNTHIHPGYTQPPLAFYQAVLALPELARLQILLCTEDHGNPVVDLIITEYSSRVELITDFHEGMQVILGAKHLVLARSTFGELLGKMAPRLESVHFPVCRDPAFDVNWLNRHQQEFWTETAYCYEYGDDYIPMDGWLASEEQVQLMTNYTVDKVVAHRLS